MIRKRLSARLSAEIIDSNMQLQEFERPEAISTSISNSRNLEVSSDIALQNLPSLQTQIIPPDNLKVVTLTAVNEDEEKQNDKKNALSISGSWFIDGYGRNVLLRGVNVSGNAKLPYTPYLPSHISNQFFDDINVSFVNRPFPLSQADEHFSRLKSWGFNFFRFCITWEAIEHYGPGIYDMEFIDYVIAVLRKAKAYGLKCFIDPHQDVWSRFCGGSGAPNWTLKLVGLDATKFGPTNAAIVHNTWAESGLPWTTTNPKDYPKMIWQTNYFKLACATMFTLFFGGKLYTPDFIITDEYQGKPFTSSSPSDFSTGHYNVEDYLQSHFINSFKTLAREIHKDGGLEDTVVLGYDTLNEPSSGYIGISDLSVIPVSQELKQGLTPTPIQTMLLGTGATCDVANWKVTSVGPVPWGSYTVNSEKEGAWLPKRVTPKELREMAFDTLISKPSSAYSIATYEDFVQYESPNPPRLSFPQGCIWKAMGLYDVDSQELLQPNYFGCNPSTGAAMTMHDFQNTLWLPFSQKFLMEIRTIHQGAMVFLEPPVNEEPPNLRNVQNGSPPFDSQSSSSTQNSVSITVQSPSTNSTNSSTPQISPQNILLPPQYDSHSRNNTTSSVNSTTPLNKPFSSQPSSTVSCSNSNVLIHPDFCKNLVYAPHWYDGLTLITKHWGFYNMDYLLVKRKLKTMLTALRFGTHGVRECMRVQLELIKHECQEFIGSCSVLFIDISVTLILISFFVVGAAPTILGEIGIPYDMDDKYAYYMGDFSSQIQALDCNLRAIESNLLNVTLWNYCPDNSYEWGDGWNGEDLSLFSLGWVEEKGGLEKVVKTKEIESQKQNEKKKQDSEESLVKLITQPTDELVSPLSPVYSATKSPASLGPHHHKSLAVSSSSTDSTLNLAECFDEFQMIDKLAAGGRAMESFVRPYPMATDGTPLKLSFDATSRRRTFEFSFEKEWKLCGSCCRRDSAISYTYPPSKVVSPSLPPTPVISPSSKVHPDTHASTRPTSQSAQHSTSSSPKVSKDLGTSFHLATTISRISEFSNNHVTEIYLPRFHFPNEDSFIASHSDGFVWACFSKQRLYWVVTLDGRIPCKPVVEGGCELCGQECSNSEIVTKQYEITIKRRKRKNHIQEESGDEQDAKDEENEELKKEWWFSWLDKSENEEEEEDDDDDENGWCGLRGLCGV